MDTGRVSEEAVVRCRVIVQAIDRTLTDLVARSDKHLDEEMRVLHALRERLLAGLDEVDPR